MRHLLLVIVLAFAALTSSSARADPADIAAASRGVVRVVLVARDGGQVFYVGHGSGVAIAPDLILTNAHVVEPVQGDESIIIGVVPSEGAKSYGAQVIAYSPGNDLALLKLSGGARVTPDAIYTGAPSDGMDVVAIGYPSTVDKAQGLQVEDLIRPQAPVKTRGSVSGGRSARQFDTILHTAPLGAGNSGGPLVDACGRVLGINSFGSVSDGNDAEFFFAVSAREITGFLRKAKVKFQTNAAPCRSVAELTAAEEERQAAAKARIDREERQAAVMRAEAEAAARHKAELDVISDREDGMALAGLLLALAVVGAGAGGLFFSRGRKYPAIAGGVIGGGLLLGAVLVYLGRPSMGDIDDRIDLPKITAPKADTAASSMTGKLICRLQPDRSRVTVSGENEIPLEWVAGGCVNGRTQYGENGNVYTRIFVPNVDSSVSRNSYDPASGEYRVERYLLGLDAMERARSVRRKFDVPSCDAGDDAQQRLGKMQNAIDAVLPAQPNELLVYDCEKADG
ncbi:S1C family serine protease [Novosphingopyxis sp.]|uniref:S1C family serine protease n=1 Tax=Novosphingopyxis sp. TaxID=2709690 RepID=UPI003B59FFD4